MADVADGSVRDIYRSGPSRCDLTTPPGPHGARGVRVARSKFLTNGEEGGSLGRGGRAEEGGVGGGSLW